MVAVVWPKNGTFVLSYLCICRIDSCTWLMFAFPVACMHRAIKILHPDFELLENSQPRPLEQNVTSPS